MVNSKKARTEYFNTRSAWVLDKFTPEEIALFFKEGKIFFSLLQSTDESEQFLKFNPELDKFLDKWLGEKH